MHIIKKNIIIFMVLMLLNIGGEAYAAGILFKVNENSFLQPVNAYNYFSIISYENNTQKTYTNIKYTCETGEVIYGIFPVDGNKEYINAKIVDFPECSVKSYLALNSTARVFANFISFVRFPFLITIPIDFITSDWKSLNVISHEYYSKITNENYSSIEVKLFYNFDELEQYFIRKKLFWGTNQLEMLKTYSDRNYSYIVIQAIKKLNFDKKELNLSLYIENYTINPGYLLKPLNLYDSKSINVLLYILDFYKIKQSVPSSMLLDLNYCSPATYASFPYKFKKSMDTKDQFYTSVIIKKTFNKSIYDIEFSSDIPMQMFILRCLRLIYFSKNLKFFVFISMLFLLYISLGITSLIIYGKWHESVKIGVQKFSAKMFSKHANAKAEEMKLSYTDSKPVKFLMVIVAFHIIQFYLLYIPWALLMVLCTFLPVPKSEYIFVLLYFGILYYILKTIYNKIKPNSFLIFVFTYIGLTIVMDNLVDIYFYGLPGRWYFMFFKIIGGL